jgi:SAM-dependent methyltransferase
MGEVDRRIEERQRILAEYRRRERELPPDRYVPWRPEEILARNGRRRAAATLLREAGAFPKSTDGCLEIGFGSLGWLGELVSWGVRENNLHGIELDPVRARQACEVLPGADLRVGDATQLPWKSESFQLVVASTVFTSILDSNVRQAVAREIGRVLVVGGALLWYDFTIDNRSNPNVRKVTRKELRELFPRLEGSMRSVTLAPPLARMVAPRSWLLANLLEAVPLLRTHLLAVLVKRA